MFMQEGDLLNCQPSDKPGWLHATNEVHLFMPLPLCAPPSFLSSLTILTLSFAHSLVSSLKKYIQNGDSGYVPENYVGPV